MNLASTSVICFGEELATENTIGMIVQGDNLAFIIHVSIKTNRNAIHCNHHTFPLSVAVTFTVHRNLKIITIGLDTFEPIPNQQIIHNRVDVIILNRLTTIANIVDNLNLNVHTIHCN